jgi:hypothetical protein
MAIGAPRARPPLTEPQQYHVQFTACEEHVQLIERAKALLARRSPGQALGELHLQAMRLLVAALERQRYGAPRKPQNADRGPKNRVSRCIGLANQAGDVTDVTDAANQAGDVTDAANRAGDVTDAANHPNDAANHPNDAANHPNDAANHPNDAANHLNDGTDARGRYVKAGVRRAVFERDDAQCTYVDERGERCRETRYLELHHRLPFARGGESSVDNLTLHCATHNALVAEQDFGRENVVARRDELAHESMAALERADTA